MILADTLDSVRIQVSNDGFFFLKICLAFILFSLAIDITKEDFKVLIQYPKSVIIGLLSQVFLLPGITFVFVYFFKPHPSIALGAFLVAACPCGNMSTYISSLSKGFVPLSISITTISTLLASFTTPFNFYLYASLYTPAQPILQSIEVSFGYLLQSIFFILILPLCLGMYLRMRIPNFISRWSKLIKSVALLIFIGLLAGAFISNRKIFIQYLPGIFWLVFFQNILAFFTGYVFSKLFCLPETHCRSISIETGIHNSGLGLLLAVTFFPNSGGIALLAAWWGIWHIVSGMSLAGFWHFRQGKIA